MSRDELPLSSQEVQDVINALTIEVKYLDQAIEERGLAATDLNVQKRDRIKALNAKFVELVSNVGPRTEG